MIRRDRRATRIVVPLLGVAVVGAACLRDLQGPGGPGVRLALFPRFADAAARVVDFDQVHVRVVRESPDRISTGRTLADTTIPFPPGADSVELVISIPLERATDELLVYAELVAVGQVVFRNEPYPESVTAHAGRGSATLVTKLIYVGTGSDAVRVTILTPDTVLAAGQTLDVVAEAYGADDLPIPGTPVSWESLEPARAFVGDPDVGLVVGGPEAGPARIVARTPTGLADTMLINSLGGPKPGVVFAGDSSALSAGVFRVVAGGAGRFVLSDLGGHAQAYPRPSVDYGRFAFADGAQFGQVNKLLVVSWLGDTIATVVSDTSARRPRWSPDGVRLAFECGDGFSPAQDVCVVPNVTGPITSLNALGDGAGRTYVTHFDSTKVIGPGSFAWDPKNPSRLFVVRDSLLPLPRVYASRFWTVAFDGTGPVPFVSGVMDVGNGPLQVYGPFDVTPDGNTIVFAAVDPVGTLALYSINRDGSALKPVTTGPFDWQPVISPNGGQVVFLRDQSCSADYWRINVSGGVPVQVSNTQMCEVDLGALGHDWSPDGTEIVLVGTDGNYNFLIQKVLAGTTAATYATDAVLIGRGVDPGGYVQDGPPAWRP